MDAVTAVSGSGPAYVFHFIECLTVAAEKVGLTAETAKLLAMQTVYGAATLAAESGEDPAVLRKQVTSPNGTTAAALNVLMENDRLKNLVADAVEAAMEEERALHRVAARVGAVECGAWEGQSPDPFANLNSPQDVAAAETFLRQL